MRGLVRMTACLAVLTPIAMFVASSVGAVTIISAGNMSGTQFGNGVTTSNVATAMEDPYCSGTIFTIRGTGFAWDAGGVKSVTMGNVPAAWYTVLSDEMIQAQVGRGATSGPIVITTGAGSFSSDQLPGGRLNTGGQGTSIQGMMPGIQVMDCPSKPAIVKATVNSIKPNPQKTGRRTMLRGTGFLGVTKVTVASTPAVFAVVDEKHIVLIVP